MPGKRQVGIVEVEQVGNYAIRIVFDDGHSTGIYSWPYLYELGRDGDRVWQAYLAAIASKGLDRG